MILLTLELETVGLDKFEEWPIFPTLATFDTPEADNEEILSFYAGKQKYV